MSMKNSKKAIKKRSFNNNFFIFSFVGAFSMLPVSVLFLFFDEEIRTPLYSMSICIMVILFTIAGIIMCYEYQEKLKKTLSEIIKPGMTEYERLKAVHDYICNNCSYDFEALKTGNLSDNVESLLSKKKGICIQISKLYRDLVNKCNKNIRVGVVSGKIKESSNEHAWNIVWIGKDIYFCDVTWDMCRTDFENICYDFFMMRQTPDRIIENYGYGFW